MAIPQIEIPQVEEIARRVREWVLMGLPAFAAGTVIAPKKGWIHVTYVDPVTKIPVTVVDPHVSALIEFQTGTYVPPKYEIPEITITIPAVTIPEIPEIPEVTVPSITVPSVPTIPSVEITRITREDWRESTAESYGEAARDYVKGIGVPWPLDAIRDWLADTLFYGAGYVIGYVAGAFFNWLWDSMIQPQIDKVRDAINTGLANARSKVQSALRTYNTRINSTLSTFRENLNSSLENFRNTVNSTLEMSRDNINSALGDLRGKTEDNINASLNEITDKAEKAVNDALDKLYKELEGLGVGVLIGKAQIANVTETGFDWYSPSEGSKLHYIVVGKR